MKRKGNVIKLDIRLKPRALKTVGVIADNLKTANRLLRENAELLSEVLETSLEAVNRRLSLGKIAGKRK